MNRDQKSAVIEEIAGDIKESSAVFAVDYRGISVPQAAELRTKLREADTRFRVVKNTLTERAADEAGAEALKPLLAGPTALAFVRGDAAAAAKAIADYARETDLLPFKGGIMDGAEVDAAQITAISKLPPRQVLYQQLVGLVASPITGLARTLNALVGGLAIQLGQIRDQGLVTGEDPEPEPAAEPEVAPAPEAAAEPEAAPEPEPTTDTTDQDAEATEAEAAPEASADDASETTENDEE